MSQKVPEPGDIFIELLPDGHTMVSEVVDVRSERSVRTREYCSCSDVSKSWEWATCSFYDLEGMIFVGKVKDK